MLQNAGGEVASLKKPFEEVAAENQAWLYRYICRLLGKSGSAAEDLLQETLIKCFKAYGSYVEQGSLEAWLSSVARNTVMSYLRSRNRFDIISLSSSGILDCGPYKIAYADAYVDADETINLKCCFTMN